MYGKYIKLGNEYNHIWLWRADYSLEVSVQEQYRLNRRRVPGFKSIKLNPVQLQAA